MIVLARRSKRAHGALRCLALAVALTGSSHAQNAAHEPGVTVYVYDLGEPLDGMPTLVEGQTPSVSFTAAKIDGAVLLPFLGELHQHFYGEVHGFLEVPEAKTIDLRLISSGGAQLRFGDRAVIDAEEARGAQRSAQASLTAGANPFTLRFYHDTGPFELALAWRVDAKQDFVTVPAESLTTEAGITHVVAPGKKRFGRRGAIQDYPGDARPLDSVHPGYSLETIRPNGFEPRVGALAFLPDGRLVIATWDDTGSVYLMENPGDPSKRKLTRFASGLGEPLGCLVRDGVIYVSQKQEITRLLDTDGDGVADRYEAVAAGWPQSYNYHEFSFDLIERDGSLFVATSVPLKTGLTTYLPGSDGAFPLPNGPGSLWRVDPATGAFEVFADGFRTPNGFCVGPEDQIFLADNQGSWLPASRLDHVEHGGFYGHQQWPTVKRASQPPAVWFPQNEIGNSPSKPIHVRSGPYAGSLLIGDVTYGGIQRVGLEKVDGAFQGFVVRHSGGFEAGINRIAEGPDGALYLGGIGSNGNWNWKETKFGLQRLVPNGRTAFEITRVTARRDGLAVELSRAVPLDVLSDPAHYSIEQWRYAPTAEYGGAKVDEERLQVSAVEVASDRRNAFLRIPGLRDGRVVHLRLMRFVDDRGDRLWSTEAWYTLNRIPSAAGAPFTALPVSWARPEQGETRGDSKPEAFVSLFDLWPLDRWKRVGEAEFKLDDNALVGSGKLSRNSFLVSPEVLSDFVFECEVKIEDQRNSGIQVRSHINDEGRVYGYQIEIDSSDRAWSGGLYDEGRRGWLQSLADDPVARAAFKRGDWNRYRIECVGPRIRSFVNDVPCADFEDTLDRDGHLMFQVHSGEATTVTWRNLRLSLR